MLPVMPVLRVSVAAVAVMRRSVMCVRGVMSGVVPDSGLVSAAVSAVMQAAGMIAVMRAAVPMPGVADMT